MKPSRNCGVKFDPKVRSRIQKKEINKKSQIQKTITIKNVKEVVKNEIVRDVSNLTFVENKNEESPFSLYDAKDKWDLDLILSLLKRGINPNIVKPGRPSFLCEILHHERYRYDDYLIRELIKAGVNINKIDKYKFPHALSPIAQAIYDENFCVVHLLIESGVNLDPPCANPGKCHGCSPFLVATRNTSAHYLIDIFVDKKVDVHKSCSSYGISPLHMIVKLCDYDLINDVLDHGVNTNLICWRSDNYAATALYYAVERKCLYVLRSILDYEVTDINAAHPSNPYSILHFVFEKRHFLYIDDLLNANPNVNIDAGNDFDYHRVLESRRGLDENLAEKLEKHLIKLRAAGFYLHEKNIALISKRECENFYTECCQQVDFMKKKKISPTSHINFHDLLFMDNQKLALCLESLDDGEISVAGFHEKFPSYAGMIEFKLKKAHRLVKLREELHIAIFNLFNNDLPSTIEEQIYNYFSIEELIHVRYLRRRELFWI